MGLVNRDGPRNSAQPFMRAYKCAYGLIWFELVFHFLQPKISCLIHSVVGLYLHGYVLSPAVD